MSEIVHVFRILLMTAIVGVAVFGALTGQWFIVAAMLLCGTSITLQLRDER